MKHSLDASEAVTHEGRRREESDSEAQFDADAESIAYDDDAIAEVLQTPAAFDVGEVDVTPAGLVRLAQEVNARLQSNGGRPTDPTWTLTRRIPLAADTWDALNSIAARLSTDSRKVSPSQVAASLLEDSVRALDDAAERAFATRPTLGDDREYP